MAPSKRISSGYWEPPLAVTLTFLIFVVARYMQWGARRDILATIRIEFVLGLVLTVACAFLLTTAPLHLDRFRAAKRVMIAIAMLFFAMIIHIPFAADKDLAQTIFVDRVIKFAMLTFFIIVLIRSPKTMRWFMAAFLFACFYVTQEAARGALNGGLIWENQGIMRLHGAVPIYRHPNSLAGVAMGVVPFVVFLLPVVKRWWLKLAMLAPLGTASICILYSGSRTGYLAFLAFLIFWWSWSRNKLKWFILAVGLGVAIMPLLPNQYVERFRSIGGQEAEGNSKKARIQILEDAWSVFSRYPAGVGVASFPAVREEMFGRTQDTHNLYLEVATNLGVQGFVVFMLLIWFMYSSLLGDERRLRRLGVGLHVALRAPTVSPREEALLRTALEDIEMLRAVCRAGMGFIVVRLVLGMFGMDLYEVYWWFAAGLSIALALVVHQTARGLQTRNQRLGRHGPA